MSSWVMFGPAVSASFLASLVEVVEAFSIILAVSTVGGWRPAVRGAAAALVVLALLVLLLGPMLPLLPIRLLQFSIGVLLLLFGMRWLRKSILRAAGVVTIHDENLAFQSERHALEEQVRVRGRRQDWLLGITAFKAVFLEGVEVVFIVLAVGAGAGLLIPAALGAALACIAVLAVGAVIHRPLSQIPENWLKFGVGVMLSAFGLFWTGEGLGVVWLLGEVTIGVFALSFAVIALTLIRIIQAGTGGAIQ
jgi:Ca2+/H+ antiporter, TMEM165/GDT1 family